MEAVIMSRATKVMAGLILLAIPTIQYGGYFLLTQLMDRESGYMANALRQNFFRAGHAHAGVIVLLSLIAQLLVDAAKLAAPLQWLVRIGIPLAGILISAGFFFSVASPMASEPNQAIALLYLGVASLAVSVITLGIGLLRAK
jgi:Ni,Fe-hydrogenase I cytochrome b subunit